MSKSTLRKWLMLLGTLLFAAGLAFMIIKELAPYKTMRFLFMIVGVILIFISNLYREQRSQD